MEKTQQADPFHTTYRDLTEDEKALVKTIKDQAGVLYSIVDTMKDGREKSVAKTKLEEAVMWAVKGITA